MEMKSVYESLKICPLCGGLIEYPPYPPCCRECHEVFEYDSKYQVFRNPNIIDISYRDPQSSTLSNLFPHSFQVWDIRYASMEAFLRGLCWNGSTLTIKNEIAPLFGANAVNVKHILPDWKKEQSLYFHDAIVPRESERYQEILQMAYEELFYFSRLFRMALFQSKGKTLIHSIGKDNPKETLLTKKEFIHYLNMLRERL